MAAQNAQKAQNAKKAQIAQLLECFTSVQRLDKKVQDFRKLNIYIENIDDFSKVKHSAW